MAKNVENGRVRMGDLRRGDVYWRWAFIGGITVYCLEAGVIYMYLFCIVTFPKY